MTAIMDFPYIFKQNGGNAPLKVRVTLPGEKTEPREITVPPKGTQEITFDASASAARKTSHSRRDR